MARAEMHVTLRIADQERHRLFLWELWELWSAMRLVNDPFVDRLESLMVRFIDGGDDEHEAES